VVLLFVDGVGLAADGPTNPVARARLPNLERLAGHQRLVDDGQALPREVRQGLAPLDARLGVAGSPQSATGQAALLTGVNAPQLLGRHLGPYPGPALQPLLRHSLLAAVLANGSPVAFANAFPDRYLARAMRGTGRLGAFARAALLAGVPLRGPSALYAGAAVSATLTNEGWRDHLGYQDLPSVDVAAAGATLAAIARDHALTLFEVWMLDVAGHRQDFAMAVDWLERLDAFVGACAGALPDDATLVVVSDHGNVEDTERRGHTLNPALGVWCGAPAALPLRDLTDVAPAIMERLGLGPRRPGSELKAEGGPQ
jgi:hypothetical protein